MRAAPFFPDPTFAWAFYLTLATVTLIAAYVDWKRMLIPKPLAFATLGLGLLFNITRGGWRGWNEQAGRYFSEPGPIWGGLDGLTFAALGFAVGFGISTPEQVAEVGRIADGVIIGSRLVRAAGESSPAGDGKSAAAAVGPVADFLSEARVALAR